jgi:uncharacterized membrane protein
MDLPSRAPLPRWPSWAALVAAAAYLTIRWDSVPARWVTHWDLLGRPNGWAKRSALGVFGPLLVGASVLILLETLTVLVRRRAVEGATMEPVRTATQRLVRAVALATSLVCAFLAVDLPFGPHLPPGALVAVCLALIVGAAATGIKHVSDALREVRANGHAAKVEGYHALYYSNANDGRLWVPKLGGMGITINFAHRWAWPVMLLLGAAPIAIVIASLASLQR